MKLLITSDIHLGADEPLSPVPARARLATLKKIMALARDHDAMLVAGDLLHPGMADRDIMKGLYTELDALQKTGTEIILTPGPGELDAHGAIRFDVYDLPFTRIFSGIANVTSYTMMKKNQLLHLYGLPGTGREDFSAISRVSDRGFHIGLFHARFDPSSETVEGLIPVINNRVIKKLNLDFYALGSLHTFRMFKVNNRVIGAYPGTPEALAPDETDDRYVISLTIENDAIASIKRLSVNTYTVKNLIIDCEAYESSESLTADIIAGSSSKTIGTVTLTGQCDYRLGSEDLKELEKYFYRLSITRNCFLSIQALVAQYKAERSLRGDFFNLLDSYEGNGEIPKTIDRPVLTKIMNRITEGDFSTLEDLL